jgi:hypothetical protein
MTFSPPSEGHHLDSLSPHLQERSTLYRYHNQHLDALVRILYPRMAFKMALAVLAEHGEV